MNEGCVVHPSFVRSFDRFDLVPLLTSSHSDDDDGRTDDGTNAYWVSLNKTRHC